MKMTPMAGRSSKRIPVPGGTGRLSTLLLIFMTLLAVILGGPEALAKSRKKKAPPRPPADVPGHVAFLARQLYHVPLDESEPVTTQIQKLVLDHLQEWSANRAPTDVEFRREMESVFSKLHYPIEAYPATFDEPWRGGRLTGAGYTLRWTDYDKQNVVALFESRDGKTRLAAVTPFVPRTNIQYQPLPSPPSSDFRFMVYGTRPGKSQLRLSAILYSFDGQSLKSLWEVHDAYDGKFEFGKDKVTLRYLKEDEYIREQVYNRKPPRHEAVYDITPQGLTLEVEREIPF